MKAFKVKVEVSPRKPALSKPQAKAGRKLAVSWKRDADATGYEVRCSTDKNFKKINLSKVKLYLIIFFFTGVHFMYAVSFPKSGR